MKGCVKVESYDFDDFISCICNQGPISIKRGCLTHIGNPIVEIRWSYDHLFSTMGFPILVRRHLYIESGPSSPHSMRPHLYHIPIGYFMLKSTISCLMAYSIMSVLIPGDKSLCVIWNITCMFLGYFGFMFSWNKGTIFFFSTGGYLLEPSWLWIDF